MGLRKEIGGFFSGVAKEVGRQAFGSSSKSSKPQYSREDQHYINDLKRRMKDTREWQGEEYKHNKERARKYIK